MHSIDGTVLQKLHIGDSFAKGYSLHRQSYPQQLFNEILTYHVDSKTHGRQLAVDVCCGTGQSTIPLTKYFSKVLGVDISEDQLAYLPRDISNLTGCLAPAEEISILEDESADLVTIGSSIQWVDREKFFKEAKRILKPGGTFAAFGYDFETLDNDAAQKYMTKIRFERLRKYLMLNQIKVVFDRYKTIEFPFLDLVRRENIEQHTEMTLDKYLNYIRTYHCINIYLQENPYGDIMDQIKDRLMTILGDGEEDVQQIKVSVKWNYFFVLGRK